MSSTLEYWVWLGMAFGSANGRTDEMIRRFGSPEAVYQVKGWRQMRLPAAEERRFQTTTLEHARAVAERMDRAGITILTREDSRYPERLRKIHGAPLVLYVQGSPEVLDAALPIAMVGTRNCSDYGRRSADKLAEELAGCGALVVSGMAVGVDTACHAAALRAGGKTVAVLGCGIDRTYPPQNQHLRAAIAQQGAVITEYPPGLPPYSGHFPQRNRIISGLALGTVVVEAGKRSGSLITAHLALEQGRDVFVVPGDIFSGNSGGTLQLMQEGGKPVCCALDILEEYGTAFSEILEAKAPAAVHTPQSKERPAADGDLPDALSAVIRVLGAEAKTLEEISFLVQKPAPEVLTALTELEIMGLAAAQAGRCYRKR